MKRLYFLAVALGTAVLASAQPTGISIETVTVHDGSVDASLDGYTTYRVYADLSSPLDFVSAVYGDAADPLLLGCTGNIFQSDPSFDWGHTVNPLFFGQDATLEYDSWFTIGVEDSNGGYEVSNTAAQLAPSLALFNAGDGFVINDPFGASWFNTFPCVGATDLAACADGVASFGGEDNRVLLAQITATGDVYGIFNLQVFPAGVQSNQLFPGLTFSSNPADVFGCTNSAATNYDSSATVDDLSCVLPCTAIMQLDSVGTPTCNLDNDAFILVSATGTQGADYFFLDSIPEGASEAPINAGGQNFGNFTELQAGNYTVYVLDQAGCTASIDVEVPVTEPVSITAELTQAVSCHNGSDAILSVVEATGGNGEYSYYISNNPTVLTDQTEWTGLSGGMELTIYAFDGNQCQGQSNEVQITNPTPINVGFQNNNPATAIVPASCANVEDGLIYLVAYGGVEPTTIEFSVDGENYGPSPLTVSGGTYTVTAQNDNGCIATMASEAVVGPDAIDVNATAMPEVCFGGNDGSATWTPVGGQGDYTYTFDGAATTNTSVGDLAPGDYVVEVTDGDGCTESATVTVEPGVEIVVSATVMDASCNGYDDGEVTVTATGGTGSFQYSENGNNYGPNNTFDGLMAGPFTFFVQDQNNCIQTGEASVDEPEAIVITGIVSEGSVTGEGTINVIVTGGELPYTYEWNGPGVSGQNGQDLNGISTGTYSVEVTDANGCTNEETFNITTDIRELGAGITATVFPNPSQGEFVVDVQGGYQGILSYHVVDAHGRSIQQGQWVATSGLFRSTLDLSGAEAGMYRLIMVANGRPSSLQLVKTN